MAAWGAYGEEMAGGGLGVAARRGDGAEADGMRVVVLEDGKVDGAGDS